MARTLDLPCGRIAEHRRNARHRAVHRFQAGDRGGAGQSRSRRLADDQPTFDQHRFSPLNQINKGNVGQLRMAWTRGLPAGTQESTPVVYRGVMYMNVPGGTVQAIDATNGDLIWEYVRDYPEGHQSADVAAQESRHLRGHDLFRRA